MNKYSSRNIEGNAIAEFSVLATIMVSAFLAVPLLGKISISTQKADGANRYAMWERTVSNSEKKSDDRLAVEVRNRFFMDEELFIETEREVLSVEDFANAFLTTSNGEGELRSLIDPDGSTLFLKTSNESIPSEAGGARELSKAIVKVGSALDGMIPDANWDLEEKGFYTTELSIELATNTIINSGVSCSGVESESVAACIKKRGAIFVDAWEASSPNKVSERVRALVPGGALQPIGEALSYLGAIPLFAELQSLKDAFGYVDPDILPPDRHGDEE